jgi:predicted nucleic acid-binding Zn ribbon protein
MATYLYETIPTQPGETSETFELQQSMKDPALTRHPATGKPVQRIITGGYGFVSRNGSPSASAQHPPSSGGCGSGCGCH